MGAGIQSSEAYGGARKLLGLKERTDGLQLRLGPRAGHVC